MKQILVYGDSLSWGLIPNTRQRLPFDQRWPGVLEGSLNASGNKVRVIEDCLNGRRTVWEDPFKPGRNGAIGLAQRIEVNTPLELVVLALGANDFQSMHETKAWHTSQGMATLISIVRSAPIEPGMNVPKILVVAPPAINNPKGAIGPKFVGAESKCVGLADFYAQVCKDLGCSFFDSGSVTTVSEADGVHLDTAGHAKVGQALAPIVATLLATAPAM